MLEFNQSFLKLKSLAKLFGIGFSFGSFFRTLLAIFMLITLNVSVAVAQQVFTVSFSDSFIGKGVGSPNSAVQRFTFPGVPGVTGGISRAYFSQNLTETATASQSCNGAEFLYGESLDLRGVGAQGNDVPDFVTFVDGIGNAYRFAGFYQFRGPSSAQSDANSTYVFVTLSGGTVGDLTLVPSAIDGSDTNTNYSLLGTVLNGLRNANTVTSAIDGDGAFSGNAVSTSVLDGLRIYYTSTVTLRPAGPVSVVSQTTTDTTPTITGSVTLDGSNDEYLTVAVNGVKYTDGGGSLTVSGSSWTLNIPDETPIDVYDVDAVIYNGTGYLLADSTSSELTITSSPSYGLTVTKSVSSTDLTVAGGAGGAFWSPGCDTYAVAIQNTGNVALDTVELTDAIADYKRPVHTHA